HVVPREFAVKEGLKFDPEVFPMPSFRGYWLLGAGMPLPADAPADAETIELAAPDVAPFLSMSKSGEQLRDALVYRRSGDQCDWNYSEFVSVVAVDRDKKTVTLKRWPHEAVGDWKAFRQGEAWVAPSVGSIYRQKNGGVWIKTWIPNLTSFCPRDPRTGLNAAEWWARHFARLWKNRIAAADPHPDGFEFDGLRASRESDGDNDGVADGCVREGVDLWFLGLYDCFRMMREGGKGFEGADDALILSDSSTPQAVRCLSLLNGSENEEFPSFGGVKYFPTGMDFFGKDLLEYPWDEYHAGREGVYNWLGAPLEEPRRLQDRLGPDLLTEGPRAQTWTLEGAGAGEGILGPTNGDLGGRPAIQAVVPAPRPGANSQAGWPKASSRVRLLSPPTREALDPGKEYCVEFWASAEPSSPAEKDSTLGSSWRWIGASLQTDDAGGETQTFLASGEPRFVSLTLRPSRQGPSRVAFHVAGEPGRARIAGLRVREGCAEVFARRFEHGLALANGSAVASYTFNISEIGGGRAYRRFQGAQAPDVNNGQPVGDTLTLPPRDGILLTAR
ncbi:MAG: hypothetical protein NTW86_27945, partial [Candidatus Sumerlaeota bacterium]|nr:hypothetical protein [Candidatus Sumerlaeota bacterium]